MILGKFRVLFSYEKEAKMTTCKVYEKDGDTKLCFGWSRCSEKDQFCKDTGRKFALKRALEYGAFSKKDKCEIWESYRISRPIPRWGIGSKPIK